MKSNTPQQFLKEDITVVEIEPIHQRVRVKKTVINSAESINDRKQSIEPKTCHYAREVSNRENKKETDDNPFKHRKEVVRTEEDTIQKLEENPGGTWLSPVSKFKDLEKKFPEKLYLIYGNQKFAYFTSKKNRENVTYNFFNTKVPIVR